MNQCELVDKLFKSKLFEINENLANGKNFMTLNIPPNTISIYVEFGDKNKSFLIDILNMFIKGLDFTIEPDQNKEFKEIKTLVSRIQSMCKINQANSTLGIKSEAVHYLDITGQ